MGRLRCLLTPASSVSWGAGAELGLALSEMAADGEKSLGAAGEAPWVPPKVAGGAAASSALRASPEDRFLPV